MGRHGGGSRSGGSSRSSSSSRSRGGSRSSGARTSSKPFAGCYNRSYVNRRGKRINFYTSDSSFGTKSGWSIGLAVPLIFVTIHMLIMVSAFCTGLITPGSKVNGDSNRIMVVDTIDIMTAEEEKKTLDVLYKVYAKSGMPITVYTDDFEWRSHYDYLGVYSEELYYRIGFDEDAMIILFTTDGDTNFYDWEYDVYCGDDTIKCFSDATFDKVLDNFQKAMSKQNLAYALEYTWNSVMDELATTKINWGGLPIVLVLLAFYSIFYIAILSGAKQQNDAYKYFKENPQELTHVPMTLYGTCPACGASNSTQSETCPYCGTLLKISDGDVKFVEPK